MATKTSEAAEQKPAEAPSAEDTVQMQKEYIETLEGTVQELEEKLAEAKAVGKERAVWPEMPASVNTFLFGKKIINGQAVKTQFQLTCRGLSSVDAINELIKGIEHAGTLNMHPYEEPAPPAPSGSSTPPPAQGTGAPPPAAPSGSNSSSAGAPPPPPPARGQSAPPPSRQEERVPYDQEDSERVVVQTISHKITDSGKHILRVKGKSREKSYAKFGLIAWPETIPGPTDVDFESWPVGQDYTPPASMRVAYTDDGKKVSRFSEQ